MSGGTRQRLKKKDRGTCFLISPIDQADSPIRQHADKVYASIVAPALRDAYADAKRIDHRREPGNLRAAIVRQLHEADLCVAILTYLKPNVCYELGIRHAWGLPVIQMAEDGTDLPFDVHSHNTVFYRLDSKKTVNKAIADLRALAASVNHNGGGTVDGITFAGDPVFAHSISKVARRFALDAVFDAKKKAVTSFCDGLRSIRHEIEALDRGVKAAADGEGPMQPFVKRLQEEFDELRTKLNVFESIASSQDRMAPSRQRCDSILRYLRLLQRDGHRLWEFLKEATPNERTFQRAIQDIENIIAKAEAIINK